MARSFNQFNGIGNLAADPEVRDVGTSGKKVCKLRVMFNDSYKDRDGNVVEKSFGVDVNVWGDNNINYLERFANKGDRVLIADGSLDIRKYQDQQGNDKWATEIVVGPFKGNVSNLTSKKEREERGGGGGDDRGDRGGSRGGGSRDRDDRDDRGGSRGGGSSRGRDYDDRGRDDRGGGSRGGNDRGGSRGGGFSDDLDDDVPF